MKGLAARCFGLLGILCTLTTSSPAPSEPSPRILDPSQHESEQRDPDVYHVTLESSLAAHQGGNNTGGDVGTDQNDPIEIEVKKDEIEVKTDEILADPSTETKTEDCYCPNGWLTEMKALSLGAHCVRWTYAKTVQAMICGQEGSESEACTMSANLAKCPKPYSPIGRRIESSDKFDTICVQVEEMDCQPEEEATKSSRRRLTALPGGGPSNVALHHHNRQPSSKELFAIRTLEAATASAGSDANERLRLLQDLKRYLQEWKQLNKEYRQQQLALRKQQMTGIETGSQLRNFPIHSKGQYFEDDSTRSSSTHLEGHAFTDSHPNHHTVATSIPETLPEALAAGRIPDALLTLAEVLAAEAERYGLVDPQPSDDDHEFDRRTEAADMTQETFEVTRLEDRGSAAYRHHEGAAVTAAAEAAIGYGDNSAGNILNSGIARTSASSSSFTKLSPKTLQQHQRQQNQQLAAEMIKAKLLALKQNAASKQSALGIPAAGAKAAEVAATAAHRAPSKTDKLALFLAALKTSKQNKQRDGQGGSKTDDGGFTTQEDTVILSPQQSPQQLPQQSPLKAEHAEASTYAESFPPQPPALPTLIGKPLGSTAKLSGLTKQGAARAKLQQQAAGENAAQSELTSTTAPKDTQPDWVLPLDSFPRGGDEAAEDSATFRITKAGVIGGFSAGEAKQRSTGLDKAPNSADVVVTGQQLTPAVQREAQAVSTLLREYVILGGDPEVFDERLALFFHTIVGSIEAALHKVGRIDDSNGNTSRMVESSQAPIDTLFFTPGSDGAYPPGYDAYAPLLEEADESSYWPYLVPLETLSPEMIWAPADSTPDPSAVEPINGAAAGVGTKMYRAWHQDFSQIPSPLGQPIRADPPLPPVFGAMHTIDFTSDMDDFNSQHNNIEDPNHQSTGINRPFKHPLTIIDAPLRRLMGITSERGFTEEEAPAIFSTLDLRSPPRSLSKAAASDSNHGYGRRGLIHRNHEKDGGSGGSGGSTRKFSLPSEIPDFARFGSFTKGINSKSRPSAPSYLLKGR